MRAIDIIIKKREGGVISREELEFLINGYTRDRIPDYQISAFLMAVFFQGMTETETADLTELMMHSGDVIDLSSVTGPKVDKHSTGGVGDKVSLILAPLAASCGVIVPMMSGRGLGHTGGTLDKLEAIPGYKTSLTVKEFASGLNTVGFAMIGQTDTIVPADKRLYALRDVTGTVESIPLISASIMSKKCAEGAESFVFDVKCGSGAFMKNEEDARGLADSLVRIGRELGKDVKAVITDMNQPLGRMVGNFLEVKEAIDCLEGNGPGDLMEVTYRLTGWMLVQAGKAESIEEAEELCRKNINNGKALEKFKQNVTAQGGDPEVVTDPSKGPGARFSGEYLSEVSGYVQRIDAYKIGLASVILGAGRSRKEDPVSPGAGIELLKKQGEKAAKGESLCRIYSEDKKLIDEAKKIICEAYNIGHSRLPEKSIIIKEI